MAQLDAPARTTSQSSPQALVTRSASTEDEEDDKTASLASKPEQSSSTVKLLALGRMVVKLVGFKRLRDYYLLRTGYKRAAQTGWNGTKLVLGLLKESSDAFPPLKSAVGGLVALIEVFERTASNKSGMNDISRHIDHLLELLVGRLQGNRETVLSFVDKPYVKELNVQLSKLAQMKSEGRVRRFVNSNQHADEIKEVCQGIERTLQVLQLSIGLSLEARTEMILQETVFKYLKLAEGAAYTAAISGAASRRSCTPGTRDAVITEILNWALDDSPDAAPVYWMSGLAGQGKTTIAHTICERLGALKNDRCLISFFCSRQLDTNKEKMLVSTIAFELAEESSSYASELLLVLRKEHNLADQGLDIQMSKLLIGPWNRSAGRRVDLPPTVIVVDALDENEAGTRFIELILAASRKGELPGLRVLITSRPEPSIVDACKPIGDRAIYNLNMIHPHIVHDDILKYLEDELPKHKGKSYLIDVANTSDGLFVYASTVLRIVKSGRMSRTEAEEASTLKHLADRTSAAKLYGDGTITILDTLYKEIVDDAFRDLLPGEKDTRERVLLTLLCPTLKGGDNMVAILALCADADEDLVRAVVDSLYPVLYIKDDAVFWHHASFQDYILATYKDLVHPTHMRIVRRCVIVWKRLLDLAKDGRFAMRDEDGIPFLQRRVAEYEEKLERDSPERPTADDRKEAPYRTWWAFYFCTSLDHVKFSDDDEEHRWSTVSDFLSSLCLELQNDSQGATG